MATTDFDAQGHRGARGLQPENTLQAFETALDLGVTTLELDLHFTADDEVVVWHDPTIETTKCRLAAEAGPDTPDPATATSDQLAVSQLTLAQTRDFICDLNPDPSRFPAQQATPTALAGDEHRISTLAEVFAFVGSYGESAEKTPAQRAAADSVRFNIETKRNPENPQAIGDDFDGVAPGKFELAILDAIEAAGLEDRVAIQSFDHRSLRAVRSVAPTITLVALTRRNVAFDPAFSEYADTWSPDYRSLAATSLAAAHDAGMSVIPWTVNDPADMERLIDLGVDGIITDRPDLLMALLEES